MTSISAKKGDQLLAMKRGKGRKACMYGFEALFLSFDIYEEETRIINGRGVSAVFRWMVRHEH